MDPSTFPNFTNLPKELRDAIWDLAVHEERKLHSKLPRYDRIYLTSSNGSVYCFFIRIVRSSRTCTDCGTTFWAVCHESRAAVMRPLTAFETNYAAFRNKAEQSTLLRELNCLWIPESHLAACSNTKKVGMPLRKFSYNPSVRHEEGVHALESVINEVCSHPDFQDISSWCEIIPLFFRSEADRPLPGLSRAVELDDFDRAFDAYMCTTQRTL
ncbi:hypothetical protein CONLIGDRAFT_687037 [Coniochaeta ligniaria NRRL 30616]|uniref:2EXR domain-containing protein n=1 Tax=Coniochaeta ligniaria NRRL 30616 TaxID=1408157 RepID=A0A1J7I687_9PEZI|nr:hypothetical protein CONLIGDRAFT_687037 [Coniochaeta ligniaria NRRL 30616]